MSQPISRREFVAQSLAAASAATLFGCQQKAPPEGPIKAEAGSLPEQQASAPVEQPKQPLFRISLAQWSLHRALREKKLDHLDFAKTAKQDYGIDAIEYVNSFFKDKATDQKYLDEMKKRAADLGVQSVLIMIDGEGKLGDPDEAKRNKAVQDHIKWVDAARYLGCHAIRVNAASSGPYAEQVKRATEGLHKLTQHGIDSEVSIIVENHGGLSSNGKWLAEVIRGVKHRRCGTLPDFGNFRIDDMNTYDRYLGVTEMMPFAKAVSAKSYDFDAEGNETTIDYRKMMKIVYDAGYRSFVGIEYEGSKLSEPDGIRATKKLLEKVRAELESAKA